MSQLSSFPCRIALEDFAISVQAEASKQKSLAKTRWEELQVSASYDGVVQKTRWLAPQLADELKTATAARPVQPEDDDDDADSSLDIDEDDVKIAASGTLTASANPPSSVEASLAKLKQHCLDLSFSLINNCSFIVWFTAEPQAMAVPGVSGDGDAPMSPRPPRVRPKRVHFFKFEVDASNANRMGSLTGGIHGDRKPTSANKEALSAVASKTGAKVSAWAKNTFLKLSSRSAASEASKKKAEDDAARQQALAEFAKQVSDEQPGKLLESGTYITVVSGVDPSEAFNAPGGRKRFQLMLKPDSAKLPMRGTGVPIFLSFTMVAQHAEEQSVAVPRNFHRFVVVMDQVAVDLTDASSALDEPNRGDVKEDRNAAPPRRITGYGFGLTSNAVVRGGQPTIRSVIIDEAAIHTVEGSKSRAIAFNAHHRLSNERELTEEDYKRLPTSVCVMSAACTEGNRERVGLRRVAISRFKTSPTDGLCKPSYKCQLLLFLRRRLESGEIVEEPAQQAIDLAGILNEEYYPPQLRQVRFSRGELMYVRLCRYCFIDAPQHRAPLLMPYDFDNEGVEVTSASNEPVAGWIYEANAAYGHGVEKQAGEVGGAAPPHQVQQPPLHEQEQQQQQEEVQVQVQGKGHGQPQPHPKLETMEDRMRALRGPQPTPESDSLPTLPFEAGSLFTTQDATMNALETQGRGAGDWVNPFASDRANTFGGADDHGAERQGFAFVTHMDSVEPHATPGTNVTRAADADRAGDFFADYGTGTATDNAPAVGITLERRPDYPVFVFGNTDGTVPGISGGDSGAQTHVLDSSRYVFGESNPSGFEITPLPDAPDYCFD